MKLTQVSRYFDRTPVLDPETGDELFRAQLSNYDGSKRDAFTAYRRIMSVAPEVVIPLQRVVRAHDQVWLVGDGHVDGWAEKHRRKHIVHQAAGRARVWSLAGYLANDPPKDTWADLQWVVDRAEEEVGSHKPQMYVAIMSNAERVGEHDVVQVGDERLFVQASAYHSSGFLEARGILQLGGASDVSLSVQRRTYNPVTGKYTTATVATVRTLNVRWQELYLYGNQLDERFQEGDTVFAVPAATQVQMEDSINFLGRAYSIQSIKTISGALVLHGRLL